MIQVQLEPLVNEVHLLDVENAKLAAQVCNDWLSNQINTDLTRKLHVICGVHWFQRSLRVIMPPSYGRGHKAMLRSVC